LDSHLTEIDTKLTLLQTLKYHSYWLVARLILAPRDMEEAGVGSQ